MIKLTFCVLFMNFDGCVQSRSYHYTQSIEYFHHWKQFSYVLFLTLAFGIHWYVFSVPIVALLFFFPFQNVLWLESYSMFTFEPSFLHLTMQLRFIHTVACIRSPFLLLLDCILSYGYTVICLFFLQLNDIYVFCFLAIMNKSTINICMQAFV